MFKELMRGTTRSNVLASVPEPSCDVVIDISAQHPMEQRQPFEVEWFVEVCSQVMRHPGQVLCLMDLSEIHVTRNLERLFILDPLPGWLPTNAYLNELAASPKHHLADPAPAVALVGLDERALLAGDDRGGRAFRDGPFLGALFESLVTLSLRVSPTTVRGPRRALPDAPR